MSRLELIPIKIIGTLIIFIGILLFILGTYKNISIKQKITYHIRIECDNSLQDTNQWYTLKYTSNNWKTSEYINQVIETPKFYTDNEKDFRQYRWVDYFQTYTSDKESLIKIGGVLNTLEKAQEYNKKVYNDYLLQLAVCRKNKPKITPYIEPVVVKKCCNMMQLY